ncbi:MAG TPA: hypothetical protein VHY75_10290 [Steroidobacteraceae bacterium]|nr:hypothetical protein [Steroidobacteraceae bacterium]
MIPLNSRQFLPARAFWYLALRACDRQPSHIGAHWLIATADERRVGIFNADTARIGIF